MLGKNSWKNTLRILSFIYLVLQKIQPTKSISLKKVFVKEVASFPGQAPGSLVIAFCALRSPTSLFLSSYLAIWEWFLCYAYLWAEHSG